MSWSRAEAWEHFGEPSEQVGSVNDPRSHEEFGVRWNEKWVYPPGHGLSHTRLILWHRYDLVGVFRLNGDGSAEPEELPTKA